MSLTSHDLVHGGFYRRQGSPDIIGRLDLKNPTKAIWIGENDFYFGINVWDGIPLTPEILREWFGFDLHSASSVSEGWSKGFNPVTKDFLIYLKRVLDGTPFFYRNGHHEIKHVHELQRLHLALTGKPLEGGPK